MRAVESVDNILQKDILRKPDLVSLLSMAPDKAKLLFRKAQKVKAETVGRKVYLRGLIEYSNICSKNCLYCGIRKGNAQYTRYRLSEEEVILAAKYAWRNRFASIVLQAGEVRSPEFIAVIEHLLKEITRITNREMHITLSLGEQTPETYRRWYEAGAHRYLLRIETSNQALYRKLHPHDEQHDFSGRITALKALRTIGYQVGTGVMIGLPFQTLSDLADDLIFFREFDVDMVGIGPYIEHEDTPLFHLRGSIPSREDRLALSLKMVAILRILMKDINIAATTAMQALDRRGRQKALQAGANVVMPNLTPSAYRQSYLLYADKPGVQDDAGGSTERMEEDIRRAGDTIAYCEWGDSKHFNEKRKRDEHLSES